MAKIREGIPNWKRFFRSVPPSKKLDSISDPKEAEKVEWLLTRYLHVISRPAKFDTTSLKW